ncbi:PREDICTED: uncharacterized protein LOC105556448 [Vollenhovia emeryi]|uniref:uncharacterized protein LOC105556448 n=1 Tax=Vollenhovia emeryi TaxID=411798 RepID=UPI0005F436BF|nr:PREDICTED: uncharacterized protein LOC105556448 [Vollenhovia emeryi]
MARLPVGGKQEKGIGGQVQAKPRKNGKDNPTRGTAGGKKGVIEERNPPLGPRKKKATKETGPPTSVAGPSKQPQRQRKKENSRKRENSLPRKAQPAKAGEEPKKMREAPQATRSTYAEKAKTPAKNRQKGEEAKPVPEKGEAKGEEEEKKRARKPRRRAPRTEAVAIKFPAGELAQGRREIRAKVDLDALGIGPLRQRKAATGALILEVQGAEGSQKADKLAEEIRQVVKNKEGVRVSRPTKLGELRVKDLNDSVSQMEVQEAVARAGKCDTGDIRVGHLRKTYSGMATAWVQGPLTVIQRVADLGRIRVGWASTRVELLEARPLICFRCLERGPVRQNCRNPVDRSGAQDLFLHSLAERNCGLGLASEPNRIPSHPCWAGRRDGSVAITWRRTGQNHTSANKIGEGEGWVAVRWGPLIVLGVYLRPSLSRMEFGDTLRIMEELIEDWLPAPVLIAGDFNAKSAVWSSRRSDARGGDIVEWAARLGLHLENRGSTSTCVRPQGESIIDLTWTSPAASRWITSWRVVEELDILSDHLPIEVELRCGAPQTEAKEDPRRVGDEEDGP